MIGYFLQIHFFNIHAVKILDLKSLSVKKGANNVYKSGWCFFHDAVFLFAYQTFLRLILVFLAQVTHKVVFVFYPYAILVHEGVTPSAIRHGRLLLLRFLAKPGFVELETHLAILLTLKINIFNSTIKHIY
jgi:hypothetical protein